MVYETIFFYFINVQGFFSNLPRKMNGTLTMFLSFSLIPELPPLYF